MITINVTGDVKRLSKDLGKIKSAIPRITSKAVNELSVWAKDETINKVASNLKLPKQVISRTTRGGRKVPRFALRRARVGYPVATLNIISSGIQVTDVAGAWIGKKPGQGGGVKAKGGRFYKGAFKGRSAGGTVRVFKRRGPARGNLFLPRIGTRVEMGRVYARYIEGDIGRRVFKDRFNLIANAELAKAGFT